MRTLIESLCGKLKDCGIDPIILLKAIGIFLIIAILIAILFIFPKLFEILLIIAICVVMIVLIYLMIINTIDY